MVQLFRREALSRKKDINTSNRIDTQIRSSRDKRLTAGVQERRTDIAKARLKRQMKALEERQQAPDKKKQEEISKKIMLDTNERRGDERIKTAVTKGEISQEKAENLTQLQKSKARMAEQVHRMTASATEKDIASKLERGEVSGASYEARGTGREGAVGNTISDNSAHLAETMSDISHQTGHYAGDVMRHMLQANTTATDRINGVLADKDPHHRDQNKEGRQTQDTTQKQVVDSLIRKRILKGH